MDWLRSVRATSWKSKFHTFPFFASRTLHCNAEILFHFQLTSLWKNFIEIFTLEKKLACEQALQGALATGQQKEGELATHLWNLNICIKIVKAKCWLVKMTLVMTLLLLAHIFQCLFKFVFVSASRWLSDIWQLSWWGATVELEVEFKFQRHHIVSALIPFPAPLPESPWELARRLSRNLFLHNSNNYIL